MCNLPTAGTGTGKTLSFALPIVERLQEKPVSKAGRSPRALVLAPTRELAKQVCFVMTPPGNKGGTAV